MNGKHKNIAGLTMVELAILMTITSLIMSVVIQYYQDYRSTWLVEENKGRMKQIATSIEYHNSKKGFFPCPSYRAVDSSAAEFGKAACPSLVDLPIGTCDRGLCRVTSASLDTVLIGGLPFKDLNMTVNLSMNDYLDTFQNQFTYAITESFTTVGYSESDAAIGKFRLVYDEATRTSSFDYRYDGSYALISHGANGVGAYNASGIQGIPCVAGTRESENCDDDDANFMSLPRSKDTAEVDDGKGRGTVAGTANTYDDFVEFSIGVTASNHWTIEAARGLKNVNIGNIAVGMPPNTIDPDDGVSMLRPEAALHVSSPPASPVDANLRAEQMHNNEVCNNGGTDCFDPEIIAGDGINCGAAPMTGISSGTPECSDTGLLLGVSPQTCPADEFVQSIDSTGTIICAPYIP